MPNSPRPGTRVRAVRLPDSLWQRAQVVAERDGITASEVTRRALEQITMQDSIYSDAAVRNAIREAIALGLDGEAIAGVDLLIDRFPELAEPTVDAVAFDNDEDRFGPQD